MGKNTMEEHVFAFNAIYDRLQHLEDNTTTQESAAFIFNQSINVEPYAQHLFTLRTASPAADLSTKDKIVARMLQYY